MTFHRLLLRLLPRHRRERYGDELSQVFARQLEDVPRSGWRRHATRLRLWLRECGGVIAFALRDRLHLFRAGSPHRRGPVEVRWAWRNLRGRGWRALLIVALLGVAMSANALVFAVADSLVFHRVPFPAADRIVEIKGIRGGGEASDWLTRTFYDGWRSQTDLFDSVHVYSSRLSLFVAGPNGTEQIKAANITPGLTEALGVVPRWGRPFVAADALERSFHPILISESLARERFGDPSLAPGQELDAVGLPMRVVGVMGADFRFPTGNERLWRALDPRGPLAANTYAFESLARMATGMTIEQLRDQMALRSPAIGVAARRGDQYLAAPAPFNMALSREGQRTMFLMLLGAALCLLLTACANVVNLEMAGALRRAHAAAIQLALGASRWSLARVALVEGALLIGAALAFAVVLTAFGLGLVRSILPATLLSATPNVIDLDLRGFGYMAVIAVLTWLIAAIPVAWSTSRASTMTLIKTEERTAAGSRASRWIRQGLLIAEIALSVLLAVTGALYARSYVSLQQLDRGFDSANLYEISFELPPSEFRDAGKRERFHAEVMSQLRSARGVVGVITGSPPPWGTYNPQRGRGVEMAIDDGPRTSVDTRMAPTPPSPTRLECSVSACAAAAGSNRTSRSRTPS